VLAIYLSVVAGMSVLLGWLFDFVLGGANPVFAGEHLEVFAWWEQALAGATSLALVGLLVRRLVRARRARKTSGR
jgi:hypothetical protein